MILKNKSSGLFEVEFDRDELRMLAFALGQARAGIAEDDDAKLRLRFGWSNSDPPPSVQELISMREVARNCIDVLRDSEQ